jgi:hypothetical protein
MEITKQLAKFLAKEGVLTEFVDNHIIQCGEDYDRIIRQIDEGFAWSETLEGHEYWHNLHFKYYNTRDEDI